MILNNNNNNNNINWDHYLTCRLPPQVKIADVVDWNAKSISSLLNRLIEHGVMGCTL